MKTMVSLVGAGIGAWDMISVRGLRCIESADCLIYDRLLDERLLEFAPEGCEKIYVGKTAGAHYASQDEINSLLAKKADNGGHIVRLKGGDPYVFGRGGEEALYLHKRGIPFQVVPGVSSSVAGACFAGIPVTHREIAREFHVATAHTKNGGFSRADYKRLSAVEGTLVLLMGLSQTADIAQGLIAEGKEADTPAAVISCAGTPEQKTVVSTLEHMANEVERAGLPSPAVIVLGKTVELRQELNFFEHRPLFGKKILLTHSSREKDSLWEILENAGARLTGVPMIKIVPRLEAMSPLWEDTEKFSYVIFTSINAVDVFMKQLYASGRDSRWFYGAKLAAVGNATAKKLGDYGLRADMVPGEFTAQALAECLAEVIDCKDRVLIPQAAIADTYLARHLSEQCTVEHVELYDTVMPEHDFGREKFISTGFDAVCFASASAVRNFDACVGLENLEGCTVFSIGSSAASVLRKAGIEPCVSRESSLEGMARTILEYYDEGK